MILRSAVNYAGRLFEAGENVKGKLPLDMMEKLKEKGLFEAGEPIEEDGNQPQNFSPTRSVAELEEYLKGVSDAEEITTLLEQEKASEQPRSGAVKLLEKKLKELQV